MNTQLHKMLAMLMYSGNPHYHDSRNGGRQLCWKEIH